MLKLLHKLLAPVTAFALLVALAGCAGTAAGLPKDPAAFTEQNIRDILATAVANVLQASTFSALYQGIERDTVSAASGTVSTETTVSLAMVSDRVNGRARVDVGMMIGLTGASDNETPMAIDATTYPYDDYLYINLGASARPAWYKIPVTESVLDVFSIRLIDNELSMFDLPAMVTYLRSETVAGTDCYVFDVVPNPDRIIEHARRPQPAGFQIDWSRVPDIGSLYRSVSYTVWIATDDLRFVRVDSQVDADLSGIEAFADNPMLAGMTVSAAGSVAFTDYDQKLVITLPEEARDALEYTPDQLVP